MGIVPEHADTVVFDVKDLEIEKVLVDGESSAWSMKEMMNYWVLLW